MRLPKESSVTLSIVVPAFNEENTVASVVEKILKEVPCDFEVILVNDGSKRPNSGNHRCACRAGFTHPNDSSEERRQGCRIEAGIRDEPRRDIVIIQDADLEYDPSEIVHVIRANIGWQGRCRLTVRVSW